MTTIQTNDGSQYRKPTIMTTAGAVITGGLIQETASACSGFSSYPLINRMRKLNNPADSTKIGIALQNALNKSGLKDTVEIINFKSKKNYKNILDLLKDSFKKIRTGQSTFSYEYVQSFNNMIKEGFNAGFSPVGNKVLINTEKMGLSGFHEIGHAINFNKSKFWKALHIYNAGKLSLAISGMLALTALLKRPKAEGEQPTGTFDKVTTFIKNNVGKLTFAAALPMVAEEIMASVRGNKLAKELLSPELAKKVAKSNIFGAASYVGTAVALALGAYAANKVRDAIAHPKQVA